MRFFLIIETVLLGVISFSCTKHRGDVYAPPAAAVINFAQPMPGSVFHYGDSVNVVATAIAANTVHGYDFWINRRSDTTKLFFKHVHDHNDTLFINQKWSNDLTASADLEAQIVLYLDHNGNTFSKKVSFKVQ